MIQLSLLFSAILANGTDLSSPQDSLNIPINGTKGIKYDKDVTGTDGTFDLGSVGTIGYIRLRNRAALVVVTTPTAPTVAPQGATGAATWSYKIVAKQVDGSYSAASPAGTATNGNATLDNTNFNTLTWTAVPGADSYDIYRTAHGTTPSTNGLIGNVSVLTIDDKGLAGDASSPPSAGIDNIAMFGVPDSFVFVTTVPDPVLVTNQGSAGAATWTYKVVAKQTNGMYAAASNAGTTTTGNATLDGTNFNRVAWPAVAGANSYDVYRTAHGTSPSTNGLIGNVSTPTIDDTGLAGDSSSAPSTGIPSAPPVTIGYPLRLKGNEVATFRFNGGVIHHKASTASVPVEITIVED